MTTNHMTTGEGNAMTEMLTAEEIQGHWELLDWVQEYDDGRRVRPFGDRVTGVISYLDGRMSAVITPAERPRFTTGGQWDADASEQAAAYRTCLAYAGAYDYADGVMVHHVDISLFPNWVGMDQRRIVEWDGQTLRLTARLEADTPQARTAVLAWRRK